MRSHSGVATEADPPPSNCPSGQSEVTLVDIAVVRFIITCEEEGIELVQCPPWVREWIVRERAEGAQPEPSDDN